MWDFISPLNLIRYLIVWRVNASLAQLPRYLPTELSAVLGRLIAERLPLPQAREWRKALAAWDEPASAPSTPVREAAWPIESVLFVYPAKRTYGHGELIAWELKLLGRDADHGLFLELILPAMEVVSSTLDRRAQRPNSLWGRFDVHAIYAARGRRWEPFVTDGKLDTRYRADPRQWADGLEWKSKPERDYREILWLTPFDLGSRSDSGKRSIRPPQIPLDEVPTLDTIMDALIQRMTLFLPGKHRAGSDDVWAQIAPEEQTALWQALEETHRLASSRGHRLEPARREWPGRWIGSQGFPAIPNRLLPYLELASILHIGRQTHFGCGTLALA
jgi:hypothetical protein